MIGMRFYKADPSTYVIRTSAGKVCEQGCGLSFFYNSMTTSITAVPITAQQAPFILNLQTVDFQDVTVQGQLSFKVEDPQKVTQMLNFTLRKNTRGWISEDPLTLSDRVIRVAATVIHNHIEKAALREALRCAPQLVSSINAVCREETTLASLGIALLSVTIEAIRPSPETSKALEAQAREEILKQADDAIYARRKAAVEQERTIKNAELQTELAVQQKVQEISKSKIDNEHALLKARSEVEQERLLAQIDAEQQRRELVILEAENNQHEADSQAYAIKSRMDAFAVLPVENLKAIAQISMPPEQLMAQAFETLAQNAGKIGELSITPDLFGKILQKRADQ